jgi:hypothetical protein
LDEQDLSQIKGGDGLTDLVSLFLPVVATPKAAFFAATCVICVPAITGVYEATNGIYEGTKNVIDNLNNAYNNYNNNNEYWVHKITEAYNPF